MNSEEYKKIHKEQKKELMRWSKSDLSERLLFAYRSIQTLEDILESMRKPKEDV